MLSKIVQVISRARAMGGFLKVDEFSATQRRSIFVSSICVVGLATGSGCLVDATLNSSTSAGKSTGSASKDNAPAPGSESEAGATDESAGGEPAPGGEDCENLKESVCLERVPIDWYGPIQPQRTSNASDLTPCDGPGLQFDSFKKTSKRTDTTASDRRLSVLPDSELNIFVDGLTGEPASCTSECTSDLDIGHCAPMLYVLREFDSASGKCGDLILDAPAPAIPNVCEHLDPRWLPSSETAMGAVPPQPMQGEAICEPSGEVKTEVSPPKAGQYYRVCAGTEEYEAKCPTGEVCTRFPDRDKRNRAAMGCIYRKGDVACPSGDYNGFRVLLYGDAVDERGCSECQVEHQKGELSCHYDIRVDMNTPDANCDGGVSMRSEDICLSQADLAADANGAAGVQGTYLELKYSGNCAAKDAEPQGDIKLGKPITLCCADF